MTRVSGERGYQVCLQLNFLLFLQNQEQLGIAWIKASKHRACGGLKLQSLRDCREKD